MMIRKIFNRKLVVAFAWAFAGFSMLHADEGMWLPLLLDQNEAEMQRMGLQLKAEDIYSINHSSLKDAVVIFGGGCTGEVVSDQGLVLTNHHCGYSAIQYHSSVEHDYLTYGFWAGNFEEELPCPGLEVRFLKEMRDVSGQILAGLDEVSPSLSEQTRKDSIQARADRLSAPLEKEGYEVRIVPFYYGNQYYMFIYEVFRDVRLVGTPPSNIGKFGGDTDNWMWPRHTGDFSVFRIYADENNRPAPYSPSNRPYVPKHHLKIDLRGYEEGDFTFVVGYPGSTQEYITSYAVRLIQDLIDPMRISARTERLDIIKAAMDRDPKTRIQYASKAAGIANGWKKWQGEVKGIRRLNVVGSKQDYETVFQDWCQSVNGREFTGVLPALEKAYQDLEPYLAMQIIFQDPFSSLDPRKTVSQTIAEPIIENKILKDKKAINERVKELMETVGLAERLVNTYPHELDGGRRQRIGIARALAMEPQFIVCDEPVSALDVSIQAQILNMLTALKKEMDLSLLFISHDIGVIRFISDRIGVMYLGTLVEETTTEKLFANPLHPYTKTLLSAVPDPYIKGREFHALDGEQPVRTAEFKGCAFRSRCPFATEKCAEEEPVFREIEPGHKAACHYLDIRKAPQRI